ncbi:hypothetical protein [Candidatus Amarolinea dominans]|uniref:hypothetical protein n=1 Tax=Candidatus Amarolinea dominans TaxID=3140696 RepID=UPI003134971C|nr:hypothetical protein [Anaerolineae bacterium]
MADPFCAGNLLSGNTDIGAAGADKHFNSLVGKLFGTDVTGQKTLPNGGTDFDRLWGAGNMIAAFVCLANVISGNGESGIFIQDTESVVNRVVGNRIGTNRTGTTALRNGCDFRVDHH